MNTEKLKKLLDEKINKENIKIINEKYDIEQKINNALNSFINEYSLEIKEFIENCKELYIRNIIKSYFYYNDWYLKQHDECFISDNVSHKTGFVIARYYNVCDYGYGFVLQNGKYFYITKDLKLVIEQHDMHLLHKYDYLKKIIKEFPVMKKRLDDFINNILNIKNDEQ